MLAWGTLPTLRCATAACQQLTCLWDYALAVVSLLQGNSLAASKSKVHLEAARQVAFAQPQGLHHTCRFCAAEHHSLVCTVQMCYLGLLLSTVCTECECANP